MPLFRFAAYAVRHWASGLWLGRSVLADMDAVATQFGRQRRIIVEDEGGVVRVGDRHQRLDGAANRRFGGAPLALVLQAKLPAGAVARGERRQIGRARCRARVCQYVMTPVADDSIKKKKIKYIK